MGLVLLGHPFNSTNEKAIYCGLVLGFVFFKVHFASALNFNVSYDSSVTSLTNAADFENAFATAAETFSDLFTNVATVNLYDILYQPIWPGAESLPSAGERRQAILKSPMRLWTASRECGGYADAVASLPGTDPTSTGETWFLCRIRKPESWGFGSTNDATEDGEISFSTNVSYTFDPNNRSVAGEVRFYWRGTA